MKRVAARSVLVFVFLSLLLPFQNCSPVGSLSSARVGVSATPAETGEETTGEEAAANPSPTAPVNTESPKKCEATRHYKKSVPGTFRLICGSGYSALFSELKLADSGEAVVKLKYKMAHDASYESMTAGMVRISIGDPNLAADSANEFYAGTGYAGLCAGAFGTYQTFAYGKLAAANDRVAVSGVSYGPGCSGGGNASALVIQEVEIDVWVEDANCKGADKAIHAWSYLKENARLGRDRPIFIQTSGTPILQKSLSLNKAVPLIAFGQNYATRTPDATSSFGPILCGQQYDTAVSVLNVAGAQSVYTDAFTPSQGQTHVMLSNSVAVNAAAGTHSISLLAAVNQSVSAGYTITGANVSGDSAVAVVKGPFQTLSW